MSLLAHLVFEHSAFVSHFRLQLFHSDTIWIIVTTFRLFILDWIPWMFACENIRSSSLFVPGDVSHGGTSGTQRQKFHTDDIKSVRNPVRSAWSTEQLHCFSWVAEVPRAKRSQRRGERRNGCFAGYLNVEGRFVRPKYRETSSRFCLCCFVINVCILVLDKTARFGCRH